MPFAGYATIQCHCDAQSLCNLSTAAWCKVEKIVQGTASPHHSATHTLHYHQQECWQWPFAAQHTMSPKHTVGTEGTNPSMLLTGHDPDISTSKHIYTAANQPRDLPHFIGLFVVRAVRGGYYDQSTPSLITTCHVSACFLLCSAAPNPISHWLTRLHLITIPSHVREACSLSHPHPTACPIIPLQQQSKEWGWNTCTVFRSYPCNHRCGAQAGSNVKQEHWTLLSLLSTKAQPWRPLRR